MIISSNKHLHKLGIVFKDKDKNIEKSRLVDSDKPYAINCKPGDIIISTNNETTGIFLSVFLNTTSRGRVFHRWPEFVISSYTKGNNKPYIVTNSGDDECYNWPYGYRFANEQEIKQFNKDLRSNGYEWDSVNGILWEFYNTVKDKNGIVRFRQGKKKIWDISLLESKSYGFVR